MRVRLFSRVKVVVMKFRIACRGRCEWWLTMWLCLVFLAHLAITHTRLGHKAHHRGQAQAISFPLSKRTEASSICSAKCFRRRLAAPLLWNTARLVKHVRGLIQYPPHQLHAHTPVHSAHAPLNNAHTPSPHAQEAPKHGSLKMEEDLIRIVGANKRGVYVVVGAGGQQWRYLAEHLEGGGWRGLLVEANAHNVAQQQAAHARAALLHACITYESRLVTRGLWRPLGADLPGITAELRQAQEEHVMLDEYVPDEEKALGIVQKVTCFPLETIVLALRTSTVDLLVLDAPRLADDLLQSLVRKRFKVKVVMVRMARLENGQDETNYKQMADDMGLLFLTWYGSYVILADPSANIHVEVVRM